MNFLDKMLGTLIAFTILFLAPITVLTLAQDFNMQRGITNEVTNFIDKVTDSGEITDMDIADFYLGCSSYGAIVDVKINRFIKMVVPDGMGGSTSVYQAADNILDYNKGDMSQVTVKVIDYTGAQRLTFRLLHVFTDKFEITLAEKIRN